mgnify:CR=1 FL=1
MSQLLENKVCIITGAAQGIGRQIAEQFAADGAIVYACDRQDFTANNEHIHPVVLDITDATSVKTAFMQIFKTEGRIDCLVNNAGKSLGKVVFFDLDDLHDVIMLFDQFRICSA